MRLTKYQMKILIILHLVIAILFTSYILVNKYNIPVPAQAPPDNNGNNVTHNKFRNARPSIENYIDIEMNFGGSKDEEVENVYSYGGKLFIVGRTESSDLDFDGGNGKKIFIIIMDEYAKAQSYHLYEGELVISRMNRTNLLLFTRNSDRNEIISVSTSGEVVSTTVLADVDADEYIIDVTPSNDLNRLLIILEFRQSPPFKKKLRFYEIDAHSFVFFDSLVISESLDLQYIVAFPRGSGYILAANIIPLTDTSDSYMVLCEWKTGYSMDNMNTVHLKLKEGNYKALGFVAYKRNYTAYIEYKSGVPDLLNISFDNLSTTTIVLLNSDKVNSFKFFTDNNNLYTYLNSGGTNGIMYKYSDLNDSPDLLTAYEHYKAVDTFAFNSRATYIAGRQPAVCKLNKFEEGVYDEISVGGETERIKKIMPFDKYILLIAESSGKNKYAGANFGGTDVWVVKVSF